MENEELISNNNVMQMVYAVEWFGIPQDYPLERIRYHPFITRQDYEKIEGIERQNKLDLFFSFVVTFIVSNRLLYT